MDDLDKKIIDELQNDFPLEQRPYDIIARRLGVPVEKLFVRIEAMVQSGLIRRLGFSFNSRELGYASTLAAISVEDVRIDLATELINSFSEVTHNYLRDGRFNIWFTLVAADENRIDEILTEIKSQLELEDSSVVNLPAEKLFKLDARFKLEGR